MDRDTPPAPGCREQPPPYSAVDSERAHQHPYQNRGHDGPESMVQTQTVIQQPVSMVHIIAAVPLFFGSKPRPLVCPSCNQMVNTKIIPRKTIRMHVCAVALCLIGFWPCVPLIYCTNFCKNIDHFCPNCDAYQGTYDC